MRNWYHKKSSVVNILAKERERFWIIFEVAVWIYNKKVESEGDEMRHFMRYFLICLVSLWILGFWYVFYGGRKSSTSSRSSNDYEAANAGGGDVYHDGEAGYSKKDLVKRLRKAERLLVQLEEENKKNEALIKELKYYILII